MGSDSYDHKKGKVQGMKIATTGIVPWLPIVVQRTPILGIGQNRLR